MKDRVDIQSNSIQAKGRTGDSLIERQDGYVFEWCRENEMKCEPSVVHILWLGSCDAFQELTYRL
jgi:hypothetical protein